MTKLATVLTAMTMAAGVAACGSSGAHSGTATQQSTAAAQPPAHTATQPNAAKQQLAARAQRLTSQMASEIGSLASNNSATQEKARARLSQLQGDSRSLAQRASRQLAPSNPIRPLIVETAQRAARAANGLRHVKVDATTRQGLRSMQSTLSSLSTSLGQVSTTLPSSGATTIATDLQALQQLVKKESALG